MSKGPGIVVIGSSNTDMVVQAERLPGPGETIIGGKFFMNAGGKGANQAVAAARLGGTVTFMAKIGNDLFGKEALELFEKEGIDCSCMASDLENPSGVALITVDQKGENCIVVAPGSNATLSSKDLSEKISVISQADILLMQLEIPMETVAWVVETGASKRTRIILNPAPAQKISDKVLRQINIITPNETEAEILTGIGVSDEDSAGRAAKVLQQKGVESVIITMGSQGAFLLDRDHSELIPAPTVRAVDTTAAGDIFNGALAVGLSKGLSMKDAVKFAIQAASISVTRLGAQSSAPYLREINS
ncbi:MAG: ribokinase [Chitinophagales bacterium]